MREVKIWESAWVDKFTYISDIDSFIEYLEENARSAPLILRDRYVTGSEISVFYDYVANKNNLNIIYTDESHPVTIEPGNLDAVTFINPKFYADNKARIVECYRKTVNAKLSSASSSIINIPDFLITDELINSIATSPELRDCRINFYVVDNVSLTKEQVDLLRNTHLNISYDEEVISTNVGIGYYKFYELGNLTCISLNPKDLTDVEINNFQYLNDNALIKLNNFDVNEERSYIENLIRVLQGLPKGKRYNILIKIEDRELLKKSGILDIPNINLSIYNDLYTYAKDDYLSENEQLDKLVEPIKNSALTPFEKYLAVYNLVKQFKPYKENYEDKSQARYIRFILNNEYIVCVGYSKLLNVLLNKVGISARELSISVDTSYDKGFSKEEKPTELVGHARNLVKIDDDKYNIHGIYVADATWDNDMENDLYFNALLTFDRKKEAFRLESITDEDLLLDFHDMEEFNLKINHYFKRNQGGVRAKNYRDKMLEIYKRIYKKIMGILYSLDYAKYLEFHNKYTELFKNCGDDFQKLEQVYLNFLTEYAEYIIPLSNQEVNIDIIISAAVNAKKELNLLSDEEAERLGLEIRGLYDASEEKRFPYIYAPDNQILNYLESRTDKKNRR